MKRTWLVWSEDYPDEGSYEIRAHSAWEAKWIWRDGDDDAAARACLLTPALRKARRKAARRSP